MKKILLFLLSVALVSPVWGQDGEETDEGPWKKGGMGALTFNQVGLFNWQAGGTSNMTLIGNLNLFANYEQGSTKWENNLDLAYGFIKNNIFSDPDAPITKAEDKIDFNSKYGRKAWSDKMFYTGLLSFRSQFAPGFANPGDPVYISKFLAPAYLQIAAGLEYNPNDWLQFFFSPVSGKITIVGDDSLASVSAFGVNQRNEAGDFLPGNSENLRFEFGATFRAKIKRDIMENIGLESQLELFSNYIDRPQNVDVRWNTAIVAKVNKYITVNLFLDLIYDHDIKIGLTDSDGLPIYSIDPNTNAPYTDGSGNPIQRMEPRTQFKEVFGVGFSYKF